MKKIKYIVGVSLIYFLLILPFSVKAATSGNFTGKTDVSEGDTLTYEVNINSDTDIFEFKGEFIVPEGFSVNKFIPSPGWTLGAKNSGSTIHIKRTDAFKKGSIGKVELRVGKTNTKSGKLEFKLATICKTKVGSNEFCKGGEVENFSVTSLTLNIKSNNNSLNSIKIDGVKIANFHSNTLKYQVDSDSEIEEVKIDADLADPSSSFLKGESIGVKKLKYGSNVIKLTVVAENGSKKTYQLVIVREDKRNNDNYLTSIIIDGKKITNFRKELLDYETTVWNKTNLNIEAVTSDEQATYTVKKPDKMVIGENIFEIVVKSQKEEALTYKIKVNNINSEFSKKLKLLTIKGYDIKFDKNTTKYKIKYDKTKLKDLKIIYRAEADDELVSVTIDPDVNKEEKIRNNLKPKDEIKIIVKGIDDKKEEYVITLVRDRRLNFFGLVLTIFLFILILITIILLKKKRDYNYKKGKHSLYNKENDGKLKENESEKMTLIKSDDKYYLKKPPKKKFSIYEEEYEQIEVPSGDSDLEKTKEIKSE